MALRVSVEVIETGPTYRVLAAVGAVPSSVKNIGSPRGLISVTDCGRAYKPPGGDAVGPAGATVDLSIDSVVEPSTPEVEHSTEPTEVAPATEPASPEVGTETLGGT